MALGVGDQLFVVTPDVVALCPERDDGLALVVLAHAGLRLAPGVSAARARSAARSAAASGSAVASRAANTSWPTAVSGAGRASSVSSAA
ncbi:hypothetical protein [Streptomyces sp. DSM 40750]|uniref:hypothetical protein n=1 Tax=Streptomyces sp. DSM 40750 TaxID=2801030 RepID=UPI00214ABF24|nr:hypothetical protein [Streptomyces sp. DSM 40750]UUU19253.1 hypothetical protein JIX55_02395 [Streptomyces sp. DSM 40750]UUU27403.1 hypothetical protein JIX55_48350 [Streptomyces sp. DSM 40750]